MRDKLEEKTVFAVHYTRELHGKTLAETMNVRAKSPSAASAYVRQLHTGKVYIDKVKVARGDLACVVEA